MTFDLARLGRLIRKELSETLRDRRTILTLFLMPVLLYPLLSIAFQQLFVASRLMPGHAVTYRLGFESEEDAHGFYARLQLGDRVLERRSSAKDAGAWPAEPKYVVDEFAVLEEELRAGRLDAVVRRIRPKTDAKKPPPAAFGPALDFEIVYLPTSSGSLGVLTYIEQRLAAANERDLLFTLRATGKRLPAFVVRTVRSPLEQPGGGAIISLASLVPLILILMTITGAVYPAIDLTAGERERGTLEILVAAPVPRLGLLFAKYITVLTVAVLTALVNLIAMTITLTLSGLGPLLFGDAGLSPATIVLVFGLLLLFAAFFSAVLLCITSFARSFKEAQAYLIPLMLASMGPGVMGMIPGLKLADWAWTPLLNIVLLGRDVFDKGAEPLPAVMVVAFTLAYAAAAISLAARIFGAEGVLYNEQSTWADLFRRPATSQGSASVSAALWCLVLMIPLNFLLHGTALLLVKAGWLPDHLQIMLGPVHTLLLFGVLPALFVWRGHLRPASTLAIGAPRPAALLAGIVLGMSFWPVVFWIMAQLDIQLSDWQKELFGRVAESLQKPPALVAVALVAIPAVFEELFFRGFLFGALAGRVRPVANVCLTTLAFAALHVLFRPELGQVRFVSSAILGVALGTLRAAAGSVWPGLLMHTLHNSAMALLLQADADERDSIKGSWVLAGVAGSLLGATLLWYGRVARGSVAHPGVNR